MTDATYKTCCTCRALKPAVDYHKNSKAKDGLRSNCKTCVAQINRRSVLRHHDKRKAEKRAAYIALKFNPDFQEKQKAYRVKNKERKQRYDQDRHKTIAPEVAKRASQWNAVNRERRRAIVKAYDGRRRAKTREGVSGPELRAWLLSADKTCRWCKAPCPDNFHVDHVIPLSKGGEHVLSNLTIACPPCNLRKNAKLPEDFEAEMIRD